MSIQRYTGRIGTRRYNHPAIIIFVTSSPTKFDSTETGAGDDDVLTPLGEIGASAASGARAATDGKYVPPSLRAGGGARGGAPGSSGGPGGRDDLPTLRVTNISEDTQENDLRDLFGMFGRVARVYVGRDRDTGAGEGFRVC